MEIGMREPVASAGAAFRFCGEPVPYGGKKKFEFLDIRWEILNFYLGTLRKNWIFQTPEFIARGFHETRWVMVLYCETVEQVDFLKLGLKRCDNDSGPEEVWVDWRIDIFRPNRGHEPVHTVRHFGKGYLRGQDLGIMTNVLRTLEPLESDSLILHCKMIIYSEESRKGFRLCRNRGIRSLSGDLLRLFYGNEYQDLELRFMDNSMKVHKVVACSRLKELCILLEQERRNSGEINVVDLSYLNYHAMTQIMEYVYSGDLRYVLAKPSLFIYDCVQKFDIPKVKSYYVPDEFSLKSSVNYSEFHFAWPIPEKRELVLLNQQRDSPVFPHDPTGTRWQLHLVPNDVESDYYDLRVEYSAAEGEFVGCIECCIQNARDMTDEFAVTNTGAPNEMKTRNFQRFLSLSAMPEAECLRVVVRVRLSDGSTTTWIHNLNISFPDIAPAETCYCLLSSDMYYAYRYGHFSDLRREVDGTPFRMHRSIIAARSSRMLYLVSRTGVCDVDPFSDTDPSVFVMLLRFIYTGTAIEGNITDEGDFVELYETAAGLGLTVLEQLCFEVLLILMQNNLVIRVRAEALGKRINDYLLRYAAVHA